ncbi:unnamed protein product [Discosporangium mesarthrocarpum]
MAKQLRSPFRSDCLSGNVALITGGGSGIGYEITRQLGLHGASVVIMGRRKNFLEGAVNSLRSDGLEAAFIQGDIPVVVSRESAEAAVAFVTQKYGGLNILVNGAAGNFLANANELKLKGFKTVMEIDTVGVFNMSTAAFPSLKRSSAGVVNESVIINISMTLHYGATWYQAHASAAKAAIDSLTRTLALEWGGHGIRVNGIAPGPIANTPGMAKLDPGIGGSAKMMIPLGRMGTTFDIAMGAVFLCSEAAAYISGSTLVVDGAEWLYKSPALPPEAISEMSRAVEKKSRAIGAPRSNL